MNIFYLDSDPSVAAQMHNNKHCVKMILETAQILCTSHRVLDGELVILNNGRKKKHYKLNSNLESILYKATHINHPCCIWARKSDQNYKWLYELFVSLCDEYTYRYIKVHKCDSIFRGILNYVPDNITMDEFTEPPLAMPDYCKVGGAVKSYREYYIKEKFNFCQWTIRNKPSWFINN